MKFLLEHSLHDYVSLGDGVTRNLLESDSPLVTALEEYYRFFQSELLDGGQHEDVAASGLPVDAFLHALDCGRPNGDVRPCCCHVSLVPDSARGCLLRLPDER